NYGEAAIMISVEMQQISAVRVQQPVRPAGKLERAAAAAGGEDRYTPSQAAGQEPVVYSGKVAAKAPSSPEFEPLREYVVSLLHQQGLEADFLPVSADEAAAAIADDGYWGV